MHILSMKNNLTRRMLAFYSVLAIAAVASGRHSGSTPD
jgi:hypothetical protein